VHTATVHFDGDRAQVRLAAALEALRRAWPMLPDDPKD